MNSKKGIKGIHLNSTSLICGVAYMVIVLLVRLLSHNPYDMIHKLNCTDILPPMWLFNFLSLIWGWLVGYAAGLIICRMHCNLDVYNVLASYRGGLFYVALLFLGLIWYPLFFSGENLLVSLVISLLMVLCSIICFYFWKKVDTGSALIVLTYTFWLTYIMVINVSISLHN